MIISMHQPHYFPWLGFFDKMAKSDVFVLLDQVQLTDKSNMFRNLFLSTNGTPKYLSINFEKQDYMSKSFNELKINYSLDWIKKHKNFLIENYKRSPYFDEIWPLIESFFSSEEKLLCDFVTKTLLFCKDLLNIDTKIVKQSEVSIEKSLKNNEMIIDICKKLNAENYLSGNGAKKYIDEELFKVEGINLAYQRFNYPNYNQCNSKQFVPNLSILDVFFNCGLTGTRELFWNNVYNSREQ